MTKTWPVILLGMMMALMMSASTFSGTQNVDVRSAHGRPARMSDANTDESRDEINADLYAQAVTALDEAVDDGLIDDALRDVKVNILDQLVEEYALS